MVVTTDISKNLSSSACWWAELRFSLTKRRDQFCWSLQTPGCRWESDPERILLHLCPGNMVHTVTAAAQVNTSTWPAGQWTHLHKVHVDAVELQPLAFVEKGDLGLRRTLAPVGGKSEATYYGLVQFKHALWLHICASHLNNFTACYTFMKEWGAAERIESYLPLLLFRTVTNTLFTSCISTEPLNNRVILDVVS